MGKKQEGSVMITVRLRLSVLERISEGADKKGTNPLFDGAAKGAKRSLCNRKNYASEFHIYVNQKQ